MDNNKTYFTTSLNLGAVLICLGISLDSVIKNQDGKSTFVFIRTPQLDEIVENFWQKKLRVEPNSFWEAQRFLKSRIYGEENYGK